MGRGVVAGVETTFQEYGLRYATCCALSQNVRSLAPEIVRETWNLCIAVFYLLVAYRKHRSVH